MTLQPAYLPTRFTHHVWYDQPGGHRIAVALCGFMLPRKDSVVEPTCPICQAILAEHERKLLPLVESST